MKYCFKCGAKLIEENQKFCIKCGSNLENRKKEHNKDLKESHKKYNPKKGESYNDYLDRIDSPIKNKIAFYKKCKVSLQWCKETLQ